MHCLEKRRYRRVVVDGRVRRWLDDTKVRLQYSFEEEGWRLGCWIMRIHTCEEKERRIYPMPACKPVEGRSYSFTPMALDSPPDHSPVAFVAGMHPLLMWFESMYTPISQALPSESWTLSRQLGVNLVPQQLLHRQCEVIPRMSIRIGDLW
jgi:hypothetical protein